MTGIERLRTLAEERDEWILGETLADVADQIERERACDGDTVENIRLIVGGVVDDMERHVSGVEGMEDSPVARWARELREALGGNGRKTANYVSVSEYDLPPQEDRQEDRDAIAWVRKHGGLDGVKKLLDWVVGHCSTKQQLDFDFWLSGRVMHELGFDEDMADRDEVERRLLARLMPEGMEWPKVDGKPVVIGERMRSCGIDDCKVVGIDPANSRLTLASDNIEEGKATYFTDSAEYCHRPTPKVLDADGAEIHEGDTVWVVGDAWPSMKVLEIKPDDDPDVPEHLVWCGEMCSEPLNDTKKWRIANQLTHRAPVIAADGRPLREGETVWDTNGDELVIGAFEDGGHTVTCRYADVGDAIPVHGMWSPSQLTHERPDSWERLEEDAEKNPCDYFGFDGEETCGRCPASGKGCEQTMARDIVRRAKKLAERERGE